MLIINELKKLKQILLNRSSLKEQAFYQFLVDDPLNYPNENDLTEIEQIIYSVFCANIPPKNDLTNLIESHRKTQPIGGMHYTKNLIELTAMALENSALEKETLRAYSQSHSTRDFYILHVLFLDLEFNRPAVQGAIDEIALHLFKDSFSEKWKDLLIKGLKETSDLIDLYIIEQWYKKVMDDNPIVHRTNDIIYVRTVLGQVVEKLERRVKFAIVGMGMFLLVPMLYWLVPLIIKSWEAAEPIIFILETLPLLLICLFAFAGYAPSKMRILSMLREKIIDGVFRLKNLDRKTLKKKLESLK